MKLEFDSLVGKSAILCAVGDNMFRLGNLTFLVKEDENDGYRSMMDDVEVCDTKLSLGGFEEVVTIHERNNDGPDNFSGYVIVGQYGDILTMGTDNSEDYYPSFVFYYRPELLSANVDIDKMLNTVS